MQISVIIKNKAGLHARPAALFAETANKFPCQIYLKKDDLQVDGKSILGIMMLGAAKGAKILIKAEGKNEEKAVRALKELVDNGFGE